MKQYLNTMVPKTRLELITRPDHNDLKFSNELVVNDGYIKQILQTNDVSLLELHALHKQKRSPHGRANLRTKTVHKLAHRPNLSVESQIYTRKMITCKS